MASERSVVCYHIGRPPHGRRKRYRSKLVARRGRKSIGEDAQLVPSLSTPRQRPRKALVLGQTYAAGARSRQPTCCPAVPSFPILPHAHFARAPYAFAPSHTPHSRDTVAQAPNITNILQRLASPTRSRATPSGKPRHRPPVQSSDDR
jgi:hypothetical protein